MLKGYVDAYKAFNKKEYLEIALKNAKFISEKQLKNDGALFHNYKNGKSNINGFLEDYAFTIEAFIELYQVTLDEKWLNLSKRLADYTLTNFFDSEKNMFYFTSKEDPAIVTRNFEYRDNVIPASNSVMAKNLFVLSKYFDETSFEEVSHQMLKNVSPEMEKYPSGFSNWMNLMLNFQQDFFEVIVVGEMVSEKIKELNKHYLPNIIIAGSKGGNNGILFKNRHSPGKTLIYVCKNNTCKLPVEETKIVIELLNTKE